MVELCYEYLPVPCIWLNFLIMSRMPFKVNPHSIVAWKELLTSDRREIWSLTDCNGTQTHNQIVRKRILNHLAQLAKLLCCVLSTYLYRVFDFIFYIHFKSESTLYSSHSGIILGKLFPVRLRTKCLSVRIQWQCLQPHISRFFWARSSWHSGNYRVWIHSEKRTWDDRNIHSNAPCR